MSNTYALWCLNQSGQPGTVCVYQDSGNVTGSGNVTQPEILAWMATGANINTQIQFQWNTSLDFVWINPGPPLTRSIIPGSSDQQVTLSQNAYGYTFSSPVTGTTGQLTIRTDSSIPASSTLLAGIGMDGAGTFATMPSPNCTYGYTPSADSALVYWITFGYTGTVGQVINPASLNPSQKIAFPYGIDTMTASYQIDGSWIVSAGAPPQASSAACLANENAADSSAAFRIYRPGVGLV